MALSLFRQSIPDALSHTLFLWVIGLHQSVYNRPYRCLYGNVYWWYIQQDFHGRFLSGIHCSNSSANYRHKSIHRGQAYGIEGNRFFLIVDIFIYCFDLYFFYVTTWLFWSNLQLFCVIYYAFFGIIIISLPCTSVRLPQVFLENEVTQKFEIWYNYISR